MAVAAICSGVMAHVRALRYLVSSPVTAHEMMTSWFIDFPLRSSKADGDGARFYYCDDNI